MKRRDFLKTTGLILATPAIITSKHVYSGPVTSIFAQPVAIGTWKLNKACVEETVPEWVRRHYATASCETQNTFRVRDRDGTVYKNVSGLWFVTKEFYK